MKKYNKYIYSIIIITISFGAILFSQKDIKFYHFQHTKEQNLACSDCHKMVYKSTKLEDANIPEKSMCTKQCHEKEDYCAVRLHAPSPFLYGWGMDRYYHMIVCGVI